jgi:16S rRNA processing protein RimM
LTVKNASGVQVPDDLAQVGFVYGAYGVAGWVRIRPFSEDADALLKVKTWWLDKPACPRCRCQAGKMHGGDVVAQIIGITDRNVAEALKGAAVSFPVAVSRSCPTMSFTGPI